MPFQRRRKCIFHWRGQAWLTIWDRVKIPQYSHRLMHRKRVTCELHGSYFSLMTIKHAIAKTAEVTHCDGQLLGDIEWAIKLLYDAVKTGSQLVWRSKSWRQDVVEKASTQQKGPSGPPIEFLETRPIWREDAVEKNSTRQKGPSGPPSDFGDRKVWRQVVVEKASTQQKGPSGPPIEFLETRPIWREDAVEKNSTRQKGPSGPPSDFGDRRVWRQFVVEKASTQQKAGPPGIRLSSPGEQERNANGHKCGGQYLAVLFSLQLHLTHKHFKLSERYIFLKNVFTRVY